VCHIEILGLIGVCHIEIVGLIGGLVLSLCLALICHRKLLNGGGVS
jgi:hypothetical protein